MTDAPKSPIRALIKAVEAGNNFGIIPMTQDALTPGEYSNPHGDRVSRAFDGSLDAALALHEALLPGWGLVVNCGKNYASVRADKDMHLSDESFFHAESISPSRAALLAILKAFEAQQCQN